MACSVIVAWYNHPELLSNFLHAMDGEEFGELFVMDNASEPDTAALLDKHITAIGGKVVHRTVNLQTEAIVQGIDMAANEVIVSVNNDIIKTRSGWLAGLTEYVAPGVWCGAEVHDLQEAKTEFIDGWCWAALRSDFMRIGGYDCTFEEPAYWADTDLCFRAARSGIRFKKVDIGLTHIKSVTSKPMQDGPEFWNVFHRNEQRWLAKWQGGKGET
jgi:GT2 family glycosyltransferase